MPAGQAILHKGGHHGRVTISVSTSGNHPKDPHVGGSFSFLGFDSRAAADRFTELDMDYLQYYCRLKTQSACLHVPCRESLEECRIGRTSSFASLASCRSLVLHPCLGSADHAPVHYALLVSSAWSGQSRNGRSSWPGS
jgi:hypothetical protein